MAADALTADKALDADERVIEPLQQAGDTIVIPSKPKVRGTFRVDEDLYKARHLIKNFFARLTQFRALATRDNKGTANFRSEIYHALERSSHAF